MTIIISLVTRSHPDFPPVAVQTGVRVQGEGESERDGELSCSAL